MGILGRNNVNVLGAGARVLVFAHGLGSDQTGWRMVAPDLAAAHRVVLLDYVGCGGSDHGAYGSRHGSLEGHAADVVEVLAELDVERVTFIGHSIGGMIGLLAAVAAPHRFSRLVFLASSPRYLDDPPDYRGGFSRADVEGLLDLMDRNYVDSVDALATMAMKGDALSAELRGTCLASAPRMVRDFARATFHCDLRALLPSAPCPSLVIQCAHDDIVPVAVGRYLASHLPQARYELLQTSGHCPQVTAPAATSVSLRRFLEEAR